MNYNCSKCGRPVEIVDIEIISNSWKRYYLYCFECDFEFIRKAKEK